MSEYLTERAAIKEYCGGIPRELAEQQAIDESGVCHGCHGTNFWVDREGGIFCAECTPPKSFEEIERGLEVSQGEA